jgi:hypothetical protein
MGSTRRFGGHRSHSTTPRNEGYGTKILAFDPARKSTAKQNSLPPKRPNRPAASGSTIRRAIWNAIAFLFGGARRRGAKARGTEPSGKRRA